MQLHRLLVVSALALAATAPAATAAIRADYVRAAQNADGGWGLGPGQTSTDLGTGWAALGLAAAGHNPLDLHRRGRTPIDFMRRRISRVTDIGGIERTVLVVRAAGLNPRRFGGRDLVAAIGRRQQRSGSIAGFVSYTSFGILALRAAGVARGSTRVARAARWLVRQQNADGGFNVRGRGGRSGIDDTGYALQALAASGRRGSAASRRAVRFLKRHHSGDGGFALIPGGRSNAQSTAYAVQGLVAAGIRIGALRRNGRTPLGYLASLTERSGRVRYSRTSTQSPVWVTAQALPAFAQRPFPLRPVRRR